MLNPKKDDAYVLREIKHGTYRMYDSWAPHDLR